MRRAAHAPGLALLTFLALAPRPVLAGDGPPPKAAPEPGLEGQIARAARAARWNDALRLLVVLRESDVERYADGRFDYLTARALAATGRPDEALPRFERFIASGDLFDVPARLQASTLRFARGDGATALELLFPLLARRDGAVARRAIRIALAALETRLDPVTLARLVAAHPTLPPRERRRLTALRAEALEASGGKAEAAALREELLREARRDDAAAIVLARELRGATPASLSDPLLSLLADTARAQRDLELAERLLAERVRRVPEGADPVVRWGALFDLARLRAGRGKFLEAREELQRLLASRPATYLPPRSRKDDGPGTAAFFARVRFNLGAVLEKLGELDAAAVEFERVAAGRVGPAGLATLQRARLELRRGRLDLAEQLLLRPAVSREPGRIEGTLLLVSRRAEKGDADGAARALAPLAARGARLPEPWREELPFWRGRIAEAAGRHAEALAAYGALIAARPRSAAADLARERAAGLPAAAREPAVSALRAEGEALLRRGDLRRAREKLTAAAALGDAGARDLLASAYRQSPGYADVLLAPALPDESLPAMCGDAAACRLLQLGLPEDAEPIVRDARRLDSLLGCLLAARLAEDADAGPAALEAAEALARKVPGDFFLELAPPAVLRGLAPRPFDRITRDVAAELSVPRDLLYAVMRQESRFDHEAASPAAARGLMQLTLPAAGEAARELSEEPPAYADLYDPARSLRLGARTLKTLLQRFGDAPAPVIAAYNAGAGQTSLWMSGAASPTEALLAAISYTETRTYLRRVLSNRALYRLSSPPEAPPRPGAVTDGR